MTSAQIRQAFLDFFRDKQHTIVPSSSLMPDSPNLLFTNAGMNQFVPIFLGQIECPYKPGRAADTQKCIRAGGKHNDLDDVGLDTYHHTFFEMLGNWSFGDYFKKEAIAWSWELIVERFKFPPQRVYASIYQPDPGDPSERDQEAWDLWAEKFRSVGLDPDIHIVNGNKKDNFWMMGETGPCGPCSEIHIDLTPEDRTVELEKRGAKLVNAGVPECIEIWNNVFIQFNANPDGTFTPLPAQHVDTGMGFERLCSIIQGTKNFADFKNAKISNYETDVFRPIFDEIEKLSGKKYGSTLPKTGSTGDTEQEKEDVAFRVIADHIRTLSFAIADGIQPGNTDRNYVLRRILRRAVRYGRALGFKEPFFYKLVDVLAQHMGDVFPELRERKQFVKDVLKREEEAFNRTLDKGIALFEAEAEEAKSITGAFAFKLYDEQGFPIDLTELMARERGMKVDVEGFKALMEEQRDRARRAQKKQVITLSEIETKEPTKFIGYDKLTTPATVLEVVSMGDKTAVVLDHSTAYAEMGGQVGDSAVLIHGANSWRVSNTQKSGNTWLHFVEGDEAPVEGSKVELEVDKVRRDAIERHHTVTHLLHWALHEVVSKEATQKGSFVGPDKLTFDFNNAALTPQQVRDVEKLVNERIVENSHVSWQEVPYSEVKARPEIMQFFGDKYGDTVRVVQIGGQPRALNGYSMELCGGTHTRATGEIGLFRIVGEGAVAAGVRRIEATAGLTAYEQSLQDSLRIAALAQQLGTPIADLEKRIDGLISQQKDLEKQLKALQQKQAAAAANELLGKATTGASGVPLIAAQVAGTGDELQGLAEALKGRFQGVVALVGAAGDQVALVASVSPEHTKAIQAGKIIQTIAPIVGGKGGGRPDFARGAGKDASKIADALAKVKELVG
ncbi:alanyl-tRNA synthetase [Roseimicrobium gellanilyticum]|uniref:Alanine--tRNA ligase n=1 Tax=Roseimicrobium gellanilyticum TaxID=748857 RepID=A0A366HQR1_9BACT|nr:alanine--tRNA ligase [Roseimicrobium gellanilyticum]RBP45263.1 alanyl-tRNA synthetase [Roseimicrobium gellanilyticum]